MVTYPSFRSYKVSPLLFLDGQSAGLDLAATNWDTPIAGPRVSTRKTSLECRITGFVRTPEGDAICVSREGGHREIRVRNGTGRLEVLASFETESGDDDDAVCLFDEGAFTFC